MFDVAAAVVGVDQKTQISLSTAVGILGKLEGVILHEQDPVVRGEHGPGHDESVDENRGPVHDAISIFIIQFSDASDRFPFTGSIQIQHKTPHLDHVSRTVRIKRHGHRFLDHGIRSRYLHLEGMGQCHG